MRPVLFFFLLQATASTVAFQPPDLPPRAVTTTTKPSSRTTATILFSSSESSSSETTKGDASSSSEEESAAGPITVESVLKNNYPEFHSLLSKNEKIFEQLENSDDFTTNGFTLFAPISGAFEELGDKKLSQIEDPRNLETAQKMGLYHVVEAEALSYTDLNREDWTVPKTPEGLPALKFGALVTMGGEVPIGRYKQKADGNFLENLFGKGEVELDANGKPKTDIIVGPTAKVLRSLKIGDCIIHEVDALISPTILWRYCDQLRIPGF